jgi:hypothetical protein
MNLYPTKNHAEQTISESRETGSRGHLSARPQAGLSVQVAAGPGFL